MRGIILANQFVIHGTSLEAGAFLFPFDPSVTMYVLLCPQTSGKVQISFPIFFVATALLLNNTDMFGDKYWLRRRRRKRRSDEGKLEGGGGGTMR